MKWKLSLLLLVLVTTSAQAQEKTWTALSVYSDGRVSIQENISSESTCKNVLCYVKEGMSCEARVKADLKAKEDAARREIEYEERVAKYRLSNPCKIREYEATSVVDGKRSLRRSKCWIARCRMVGNGLTTKMGSFLANPLELLEYTAAGEE